MKRLDLLKSKIITVATLAVGSFLLLASNVSASGLPYEPYEPYVPHKPVDTAFADNIVEYFLVFAVILAISGLSFIITSKIINDKVNE
jgi:ABC-type uncharacterized transport system permease subunit